MSVAATEGLETSRLLFTYIGNSQRVSRFFNSIPTTIYSEHQPPHKCPSRCRLCMHDASWRFWLHSKPSTHGKYGHSIYRQIDDRKKNGL